MAEAIDPAHERTPPAVAAMKSFKSKLLQGHKVKAAQFGLDLPVIEPSKDIDMSEHEDIDLKGAEITEEENAELQQQAFVPLSQLRPVPDRDPAQMLGDYLAQTPAREEVKVIGPFGKLGFKAVNVSITDFGVAFIIRKDAIQFEPNLNTDLIIQYRGQDYSVVYAGGFFTFPKIPFTFVSFIRVTN